MLRSIIHRPNPASGAPDLSQGDDAVTALVLCGGKGSRMQGKDKGLINWQGKPLVEHVLTRLPPLAATLISANRNLARYERYGYPVVQDSNSNMGPLGGVAAAAPLIATPWLLIVAGDAPLLPKDIPTRLVMACRQNDTLAACVETPRLQPLPLLVARSALGTLTDYLADQQRAVKGWVNTFNSLAMDERERAACFTSFNYPADLDSAMTQEPPDRPTGG